MIANFHARAIADIRGAKLVACFDAIPAAADRLAAATGCRAYHRLTEMLADPAVDVVTVGTPSGAHLEPAVAAARAGKHVIVEKPLEITLKRCDKIIRECEKNQVKLSAIFPSRFHQSSIELKRAVDAGRFGRLTLGESYVKWYRTQAYYDSGAWRGTWELDGGGALMNQAIHSVDILTWLMGPVAEITAHTALVAHERIAVEDTAVATLKFANGALGVHRSQHGGLSGLSQADRNARLARQRRDGGRRRRRLGLRQEDGRRRGGARANGRPHQHGRRRQRSVGHRPSRPHRPVSRRAGSDSRQPPARHRRPRRPPSVEIILGVYKAAETGKVVKLPLRRRSRAGGAEEAEIGGECSDIVRPCATVCRRHTPTRTRKRGVFCVIRLSAVRTRNQDSAQPVPA